MSLGRTFQLFKLNGRVVSHFFVAARIPLAVSTCPPSVPLETHSTSLHALQITTDGWFRSRRTSSSMSPVLRGVKIRFSSQHMTPTASMMSYTAGSYGLCDVRHVFPPTERNAFTLNKFTLSGTAVPVPPKSWWCEKPRRWSGAPFSAKPPPGAAQSMCRSPIVMFFESAVRTPKMLGGASQTVSKIRVECNGK